MDICHFKKQHYLTRIHCGPFRDSIYRKNRHRDTTSVVEELGSVFFEWGAPKKLLTDKAASFRGVVSCEFSSRWGMTVSYRCASVPSGNGL